jgi:hypothetical protein
MLISDESCSRSQALRKLKIIKHPNNHTAIIRYNNNNNNIAFVLYTKIFLPYDCNITGLAMHKYPYRSCRH